MSDLTTLHFGDRHLRPIGGLTRPTGQQGLVRITASESISRTVGGQRTLWMLANLIARQFGVVTNVELAVPDVQLFPHVGLFGGAGSLAESLANAIRMVAGTSIRVVATDTAEKADVEVSVGRLTTKGSSAVRRLGVGAAGWRVFAGNPDSLPESNVEGNSLGCYFAACIAAGEVFKHLCGLQQGNGQFINSLVLSLWDFHSYSELSLAPDGPSLSLELPPFYLVGAGAVGQAAAAALASSELLRGHATVIDYEGIDATNLNRYPLATLDDIGAMKTNLLCARLAGSGFTFHRSNAGWPGYALNPETRVGQRADLHELEAAFRYRLVLSCVDKNVPRHDIQNYFPAYLIGASTNGLGIAVAAYDMRSDFECLKCHNPREAKGPAVEAVAEQLRQLPPEERRKRAEECGADWQAVEHYLSDPKCGKLGESEMEKFTAGNPDWSVGFVSTASGTLLAAQVVKFALLGRDAFPDAEGNTLRLNFLNPVPRWSMHRRNPGCDCGSKGKAAFMRTWRD